MFVVVFQQVCTDLGRDFGPLLFADPLQILKVPKLSLGISKLQLPPQIFNGIGHIFWVIVMLEDPSMTHFQCSHWGKEVVAQNFPVYGPIHPPLDKVKSSCPLSWETPPKQNASQWGWCAWGCTQHFSSSKHGKSSWCQIALFWSHLTTSPSPKPQDPRIIQVFFGKLQKGLYMCLLQQRKLAGAAGF